MKYIIKVDRMPKACCDCSLQCRLSVGLINKLGVKPNTCPIEEVEVAYKVTAGTGVGSDKERQRYRCSRCGNIVRCKDIYCNLCGVQFKEG